MADGTRTPGVELVTLQPEIKPDAGNFQIYVLHVTVSIRLIYQFLVGLPMIVHGQGLVAATEAHPGLRQHDVAKLARSLSPGSGHAQAALRIHHSVTGLTRPQHDLSLT